MVNYSIGDLLVRVKNASMIMAEKVSVPKFKYGIAALEVLKAKEFIKDYEIVGSMIDVELAYDGKGMPLIQNVKIFSRPGRRWYIKAHEMTPVRSGTGIKLVSTPKGVMTTMDAKKNNLGGELICEIW